MEVSALRQASVPGLPGSARLLRLQSDERLIALVRQGHHAAFEALVARYQARLLSFCRHMLGSREDAEDVLQEVFSAAYNAILADDRDINARPWLYRIARNRSLNHLRRATAIGSDSMDVYFADQGQSTGEKILRRESFRQLISDVQRLPETQRTALLLREIDALSYEQIAETMQTTVPSVKSLLVRARISLAEAAEARKLSCDEVRMELGEVAEGLVKISAPARRHARECERCSFFRKQLRENNRALAAILPVAPLVLLKKFILAKLGSTAGAGHVAAGGGATATAGAAAGAGAAGAGGTLGGLASIGAGAIATKAVAGLAAAAIVTAGAVEANHSTSPRRRHHHAASVTSVQASSYTPQGSVPVVIKSRPQPVSTTPPRKAHVAATHHHTVHVPARSTVVAPSTVDAVPPDPQPTASTTTQTKAPAPKPAVTQVTTETTELPSVSQQSSQPASSGTTEQPPTSPPVEEPPTTTSTTDEPPPPAEGEPAAPTEQPAPGSPTGDEDTVAGPPPVP